LRELAKLRGEESPELGANSKADHGIFGRRKGKRGRR
jgi:hypothetical protein